ncbi:Splicing factor YJU2 [Coccomyxa sp. Obi]|nr:Splicing factor YJU2 [Coccomyxa sp. Obi]
MGERKVLNKYFPPDFDPAKLPRGKRAENNVMKVRMMLPMSIRCGTCGTYMYKGTKFNTRKEDVEGENYLGIQVFRFYFRCSACAAEITMKTDPEHADYSMEQGATRNYEPWREKDREVAEAVAAREEEERGNAMKALENRTLDSKREMDIMNALDEMKSLKARQERVDSEALLSALKRSGDDEELVLDEEDEAAVRAMLMQQQKFVRRLDDEGLTPASSNHSPADNLALRTNGEGVAQGASSVQQQAKPAPAKAKLRPVQIVVKAKRKVANDAINGVAQPSAKRQDTEGAGSESTGNSGEGLGGLLGYGSSDEG